MYMQIGENHMDKKFTVIKQTETDYDEEAKRVYRIAQLNEAWERQYYNSVLQAMENNKGIKIADYPQSDLMKIALCGIKYICSIREVKRENDRLETGYEISLEEHKIKFQLIDAIFTVCGHLKLKNFVTTFPITKDFNGHKWECKDYFYTMEVLSKMDWNKPIGRDKFFDFLWDYENNDLRNVCVEYMCAMSKLCQSQTGKGIAEQWCDDMGIGTYTVDKESGIVKDNQTGNITKLKKSSHLHIVK